MERVIPASELIINPDGSVFHLHIKPEMLVDNIILVGDPGRVDLVASFFDKKIHEVSSREFHTITGEYHGKPVMCVSHGIGADNIDIVVNELDALANVDFETRTVKKNFRQLSMVRIGTSGSIQEDIPVGSMVIARKALGIDGAFHFYKNSEKVRDIELEDAFISQSGGNQSGIILISLTPMRNWQTVYAARAWLWESQSPPMASMAHKDASCALKSPIRTMARCSADLSIKVSV